MYGNVYITPKKSTRQRAERWLRQFTCFYLSVVFLNAVCKKISPYFYLLAVLFVFMWASVFVV